MPRVLLVEDSPTQAKEIEVLLEEAGYVVMRASDGTEALRAIRTEAPDLVVSDLNMPGMDGLALVDAVRHDFPFIPVVLVTAYGSEGVAARALRDGAASYVPKRDLHRDLVPTLGDILAVAVGKAEQQRILRCLTRMESHFELDNDPSLVTPLVRHLEENLAAMRFCDPTTLIRVAVALREVVINAIDHGNLELSSELRQKEDHAYWELGQVRRNESPYRERRVRLTATITPVEATFVVQDEGPGFDPSTLPDPTEPANLHRVSGRGLLLIRTFMDEVKHNAKGNEVTLIKRCATTAH